MLLRSLDFVDFSEAFKGTLIFDTMKTAQVLFFGGEGGDRDTKDVSSKDCGI